MSPPVGYTGLHMFVMNLLVEDLKKKKTLMKDNQKMSFALIFFMLHVS